MNSEELVAHVRTRLERVRRHAILSHPFLGNRALRANIVVDDNTKTAATNGKRIRFGTKFSNAISDGDLTFVLLHELCHIALCHHVRRGARNPELWNVACDFVVNLILVEAGFKVPTGALFNWKWKGKSEEQIYSALKDEGGGGHQPPPPPEEEGEEEGEGGSGGDEGGEEEGEDEGGSGEEEGGEEEGEDEGEGGSGEEEGEDEGEGGSGGEEEGEDEGEGGSGEEEGGEEEGEDEGEGGSGEGGGGSGSGEEGSGKGGDDYRNVDPGGTNGETKIVEGEGDYEVPDPSTWGEVEDQTNEDGSALSESDKFNEIAEQAVTNQRSDELEKAIGTGDGGNGFSDVFGDALEKSRIDWRAELDEFVRKATGDPESTWDKSNRRFIGSDLYLPGYTEDGVGAIAILSDCSGSVGKEEFALGLSQVEAIVNDLPTPPEVVVWIQFDTQVRGEPQIFENGVRFENPERHGYGGTVVGPAFDRLRQVGLDLNIEFSCVVVLTDLGIGDFHSCRKVDAPLVWADTYGQFDAPPFGRRIIITKDA